MGKNVVIGQVVLAKEFRSDVVSQKEFVFVFRQLVDGAVYA